MTNGELAQALRDLRDFLIIAGYEESHATRYTHIARAVEKLAEPVETLRTEGRLTEIPMVGSLIKTYIKEIMETGVSSKQREWESHAPFSVVEMCRVPGLGAKTAKKIFETRKITNLADLQRAVAAGELDDLPGVGPKMRAAILATPLT